MPMIAALFALCSAYPRAGNLLSLDTEDTSTFHEKLAINQNLVLR